MKRIITVMGILFILTACTLALTGDRYAIQINDKGTFSAFILSTSTNTQSPTETPQIYRTLTVLASTNLRATPSTTARIVQVIRQNTPAIILTQQGQWYRVSIQQSATLSFEGWVRNDRIINVVSVTVTPSPTATVIVTPTQEIILRIDVPIDGLQGFACMREICLRPNLYLSVYDDYRVVWRNDDWAWICILDSAKQDCIRQFYVQD